MNTKHEDHGGRTDGSQPVDGQTGGGQAGGGQAGRPSMNDAPLDCSEVRDWLDLTVDGASLDDEALLRLRNPAAVTREALESHLVDCPECRAERQALEELTATLAASRTPVSPDFHTAVMASLPAAGWEGASPRTWAWPMALLLVLAISTASLLGFSSARLHPEAPFIGALAAIGDLASTSLLAGAGFLSASWRGLGLAISELLSASRGNLVAFIGLVLAVNGWLFLLLRRRTVEAKGREKR